MKPVLFLLLSVFTLMASSQVVNNMVVFCNDAEPFTLILNGERINMTPQTRVKAEGLTLKKYDTKVIFQNPKLKEATTTITFFSSGYECEFVVKAKSKKKYKIEYFTEKKIDGLGNNQASPQNNIAPDNNTIQNTGSPNNGNNSVSNETVSTPASPTNSVFTGPGMSSVPVNGQGNVKCNEPLSNERLLTIIGAMKQLPTDHEKEAKALLMMEGACLTVNQLKQLLNSFLTENAKYNFAKQVYERTKDNSDFVKLSETFIDTVVKDKFQKFLQSKK